MRRGLNDFFSAVSWIPIYLALVAASLALRPLLPVDETRYVSVAWEMWHSGDFLVPHLNGIQYSHKPPLLFWLINLGWFLTGVNEWSARIIGPFFGLCNLFLTAHLSRRLWPEERSTEKLAPFVLLAFPLWAVFSTLTMFDMMLTFFVLLATTGLVMASCNSGFKWWGLSAVAVGLGLLAKGPVMLLFIVPVGLLAPWWTKSSEIMSLTAWYCKFLISLAFGFAILISWAIPAAQAGGAEYGQAILWHQTADRIINSFSHRHPVWWYIPLLPVMLFPWFFNQNLWTGISKISLDRGTRICLSMAVPPFILLSFVSCKQIHYLLPVLPPAAMLGARIICRARRPVLLRYHWPPAFLLVVAGVAFVFLPQFKTGSADIPVIGNAAIWGILIIASGLSLFLWRPADINSAVRGTCIIVAAFIMLIHIGPFRSIAPAYDVSQMAARIAAIQKAGKKIAHYRKYHDQYHFAGRLLQPVTEIVNRKDLAEWIKQNPTGYIVTSSSRYMSGTYGAKPEYAHPFRGRWSKLWKAKAISNRPEIMNNL